MSIADPSSVTSGGQGQSSNLSDLEVDLEAEFPKPDPSDIDEDDDILPDIMPDEREQSSSSKANSRQNHFSFSEACKSLIERCMFLVLGVSPAYHVGSSHQSLSTSLDASKTGKCVFMNIFWLLLKY